MNLEILLSARMVARWLIYRSLARSLARAPLDLIFRHGHREQRAASPNAMQKTSYRRETRRSLVARDLTHEPPRRGFSAHEKRNCSITNYSSAVE